MQIPRTKRLAIPGDQMRRTRALAPRPPTAPSPFTPGAASPGALPYGDTQPTTFKPHRQRTRGYA